MSEKDQFSSLSSSVGNLEESLDGLGAEFREKFSAIEKDIEELKRLVLSSKLSVEKETGLDVQAYSAVKSVELSVKSDAPEEVLTAMSSQSRVVEVSGEAEKGESLSQGKEEPLMQDEAVLSCEAEFDPWMATPEDIKSHARLNATIKEQVKPDGKDNNKSKINIASKEQAEAEFESSDQSIANVRSKDQAKVDVKSASLVSGSGEQVDNFFASFLYTLLGPVFGVFSKIFDTYQYYKDKGQAPVFLLTVTGIAAMVAGFGYLLQFSFNNYLGDTSKVVLSFLVAAIVSQVGVRLSTKTDMKEYAAAIISLGVLLGYMSCYFAGPYYGVLNEVFVFIFLSAVTCRAYNLAIKYETRVVAAITLVGGALIPVFFSLVDVLPTLYIAYLLVLTIFSLRLSAVIQWPSLAHLTLVVSVACIAFCLLSVETVSNPVVASLLLHGFFYSFCVYIFITLLRSGITWQALTLFAANFSFIMTSCYQLFGGGVEMGYAALLNVLVCLLIGGALSQGRILSLPQSLKSIVTMMTYMYIGAFVGVAVIALCENELVPFVWSMEGFALIWLGFKYRFKIVRSEGYVVLLLSVLYAIPSVAQWLAQGFVQTPSLIAFSVSEGWYNFWVMFAIVAGVFYIYKKNEELLGGVEQKIFGLTGELLSVFISVGILSTVSIVWADGVWLFAPAVMFILLERVHDKQSKFTEMLAILHVPLVIIFLVLSASLIGSSRFSDQTLVAQIARVEVFLTLWLLAEYYQRRIPDGNFGEIARGCRHLFFMVIPVLLLPKIWRDYNEYFTIALWFAFIVSGVLYYRTKLWTQKLEMECLAIVASIAAVVSCFAANVNAWSGYALPSLVMGAAIHGGILWYSSKDKFRDKGAYAEVFEVLSVPLMVAVYYFGVTIFIFSYLLSGGIGFGLIGALIYTSSLYFYSEKYRITRKLFASLWWVSWSLITVMIIYGKGSGLTFLSLFSGLLVAGLLSHKYTVQTRWVLGVFANKSHMFFVWYFHVFVVYMIYLVSDIFLGDPGLWVTMSTLYVAGLYLISGKFKVMRGMFVPLWWLAWSFSLLMMNEVIPAERLVSTLFNMGVVLGVTGLLSHSYTVQTRCNVGFFASKNHLISIWVFHAFVAGVYMILSDMLFSSYESVAISMFMVVHSMLVLFLSLKPKLTKLIWLSAVIFSIATVKVFVWDMGDFALIEKVIAFMSVGGILLVAAFYYQKGSVKQV